MVWLLGIYVRGKLYDYLRDKHYNDSWRAKKKNSL